jgi:YidC/Oxa1 family membrane protein insertase
MDRKSVTVLLVCFLLLMLWHPLINYIFPPTPLPDDPAPITAPGEPVPPRDPFSPDPPPILAPRPGQLPIVRPDAPEELVTIEDEVARYTFTSHGGGVKLVELKNYPATVDCRPRREHLGDWASLNTRAPVPAMSLLGPELEEDGVYHLTRISDPRTGRPAGVRAEKTLSSGLQITKEFLLSTNHLLRTQIHLVNPTDGLLAIPAHEWVIGTSTPIGQRDETFMMGFEWFNGTRTERLGESYFANRTLGCFPGQPRYQYNAGASNVVWAAVHNQFFTMIALPSQPAPQIMGRRVDLPPPTEEAMAGDSRIMAHPVG